MSPPTPVLSAIMCDGMGWFSDLDYKRMLLLYDKIFYLVPTKTVEFTDLDGDLNYIEISREIETLGFEFHNYAPDNKTAGLLLQTAQSDAVRDSFISVVNEIPAHERAYTWRITNADADLGRGRSPAIGANQDVLAHALLLNKFLLAAELKDAVPITGKGYVHRLISEKCRSAGMSVSDRGKGAAISREMATLNPVAVEVIEAIVPDLELERRTEQEIIEYKEKHRRLFESFSYTTRKLVNQIGQALPGSSDFDQQLKGLINTEVWREKTEVERALKSAWSSFFKETIKSAVGGAIAVGVSPFLSLGHLSLAAAFAGAAAVTPWATSELIKIFDDREKARQHGLYYLMNLKS